MKIHTYLCVIALICSVNKAFSQDQLFKKDNSKLLVKITEINSEEIKYKLFDNLNGPIYGESKSNVSLIIYENGQHEVFNVQPAYARENTPSTFDQLAAMDQMTKADSITYYSYSNNISINFFNFFNNEIGITYQKDVLKSHYNIIIPLAVGIDKPGITQSTYFGSNNQNYNNNTSNGYALDRKMLDVGFGINYYPSLRSFLNYYIGPMFKYMQYAGTQTYNYQVAAVAPGLYPSNITLTKHNVLNRYTLSITNGVIVRTRSRLTLSAYGSIGFKNDVVRDPVVNPVTSATINPIKNASSLFFWCGFNVGFNF